MHGLANPSSSEAEYSLTCGSACRPPALTSRFRRGRRPVVVVCVHAFSILGGMSIHEGVIRRSGRWILGLPRRWRCPCCARQRVSHELAIRALVWRCYDDLGSCPRPRRCRGVGFFSTKTPGSAPGSSGGHRAISREVASCPKDFSTRPVLKKKAEVYSAQRQTTGVATAGPRGRGRVLFLSSRYVV